MKYKYFGADSQAAIEQLVNNWASQQKPPITVRHSDTKMTTITAGGRKITAITVGIWYD